MARKVRRRSAAERSMPTAPQLLDIEIAQLRNLEIERRTIRQRRTDSDARHGNFRRSDAWMGETPRRGA